MEPGEIEALRSGAPLSDPKLEASRSFTRTLIANRGKASEADLQIFFNAGYSLSVANSYSRGDREFEKATAMLSPSEIAQRGRMRDHTAAPFGRVR